MSHIISGRRRGLTTAVTACLTALGASSVSAQDNSADPRATGDSAGKVEEIIVTAQRRAESIQDVPITMSAISGEQLEQRGVDSTLDIQHTVPGITVGQSAGWTNFYTRGIGNAFATPTAQSPIAFYVDGVYIADVSATAFELTDVDHIEILKGPQGTLYGRNAVGGAISIYTKMPESGFRAEAQATYGNYDTRKSSLYLTGGSERLQASFSASKHDSDGYYENLVPGGRDLNAADALSLRGKLRFVPNDSAELILAGDYTHDEGYGFTGGGAFGYPEAPGVVTTDVLLGGQVTDRPWRTTYTGDLSNDMDNWGTSFTARFDLGPVRLVSISAYRSFDFEHGIPSGGGSTGRNIIRSTDLHRSTSQEFQLLSDTDGRFSWIAGAYYLHDKAGFDPLAVRQNIFLPLTIDIFSKVKSESYALFGEGTYELTDSLSLIAGVRYSKDELEHYEARQVITLPVPPFNILVDSSGAEESFSGTTPRISLKYERPEGIYYATFSKGYRAGLFNASNIAPTAALDAPVSPERLDAYEVGAKWNLFHSSVVLNLAGFYYEDKDMQLQSLQTAGGTAFQNASGRVRGIDADIEWRALDYLTLRAAAEYLDTEYTAFANAAVYVAHSTALAGTQQGVAPCPGGMPATIFNASCLVSQDLTGEPFMRAPEFTGMIGADVDVPLPQDRGAMTFTTSLYHSDEFRTTANGTMVSPSYQLVNASLRYVMPNERVNFTLFGTNLSNAKYFNTGGEQELTRVFMYGPPRMYGVTVGVKFD